MRVARRHPTLPALASLLRALLGALAAVSCTGQSAATPPFDAGAGADTGALPGADAGLDAEDAAEAAAVLPLVTSFGERPIATVKGVTTDTELHGAVAEQGLNFGKSENIVVDSDPPKVGLLRFDLRAVPPGRPVLQARLKVWTSGDQGCQASGTLPVDVYRLLEGWDEGSGSGLGSPGVASFAERRTAAPWQSPGATGASRQATPEASFSPSAIATEYEVDLTGVVSDWVTNPGINHGILLSIGGSGDGVCLLSSQSQLPDRRPLLTITFAQ